MRTVYQISGSTSVTSRENGAVQEMVIESVLLVVLRSLTDCSEPEEIFEQTHHVQLSLVYIGVSG